MKIRELVLALSYFSFPTLCSAQTDGADAMLLEAMKNVYSMSRDEAQNQNYKSYFSSERFLSDGQSGKWDMGIDVIVEGLPIGLNAGSSHEERKEFQEKIKQSSSVVLSSSTRERLATRILDPEVLSKYTDLVRARQDRIGFKTLVEDNGRAVVFTVSFTKLSDTTPWPMIRSLAVDGGILLDNQQRIGTRIDAPLVLRTRRDGDSEVILTLETSDSPVVLRAAIPESVRLTKGLPVGSIITSVLPLDKFLKASGERVPYDPITSKWAPADGRDVPSNEYIALTNKSVVPDLRGIFLRGLNTFDPSYTSVVSKDRSDPDLNRSVMSYQVDAFKAHSHDTIQMIGDNNVDGVDSVTKRSGEHHNEARRTGTEGNDTETRPKNVAVYYYIKIR
jgi:hypothetical protein